MARTIELLCICFKHSVSETGHAGGLHLQGEQENFINTRFVYCFL